MPTFTQSTFIDAPVEAVFAFHERPDALTLLSPPFPPVRLHSRTGQGIQPGAELELRIGPIRWLARHTQYEPNRLFVDEQIAGPFAHWIHRHEFTPDGSRTRLTDHIDFQLPGGPLLNTLLAWPVKLALRNMFTHRHRVTREHVCN